MTNNYIKMTTGYGDKMFFFDSRVTEAIRDAYAAAQAAKVAFDTRIPLRGERVHIEGKPLRDGKARLSIWKHCGGLKEALPEIGEYVPYIPMQEDTVTS